MNPVSSVGGSPQANEPATPTSKRAASVSPGEMRATETDDSPLSDLGSSPFSPPSPSPFRPSTHGSGSTTRLRPSSIKHRKTGSEGTQLSSRSVQFSLDEPQTRVVEWDDDEGSDVSSSEGEESGSDYEQSLRLASKPKCRVATGPKPSPKHRSVTKSSVGRGVKKLVLAADPKHLGYAICLLTNTPKPKKSCQFCHVLARRTRAEILAMLEWWWQLPYWTLYVDTRYNIFVLMANWHLAMDGNDWTLVPHHTLITDLSNWTNEMLARDPTGYNKDERSPISKVRLQQVIHRVPTQYTCL
ncbi:hypothetical protein B0H19DRAFT_482522 [Mycena capillaripes]|nr:hypothetical protein B0H19DRAFT_482522 [Mycena capillaripes]